MNAAVRARPTITAASSSGRMATAAPDASAPLVEAVGQDGREQLRPHLLQVTHSDHLPILFYTGRVRGGNVTPGSSGKIGRAQIAWPRVGRLAEVAPAVDIEVLLDPGVEHLVFAMRALDDDQIEVLRVAAIGVVKGAVEQPHGAADADDRNVLDREDGGGTGVRPAATSRSRLAPVATVSVDPRVDRSGVKRRVRCRRAGTGSCAPTPAACAAAAAQSTICASTRLR